MIRTYKFVKYLEDFGWKPVVLTVNHKYYIAKDEALLDELPKDLIIYRTKLNLIQRLIGYFRHSFSYKLEANANNGKAEVDSRSIRSKIFSLLRNIKDFIITSIFIPDDFVGWKSIALREAAKILQNHQVDLIYSSSPPHSIHLAALAIHKKFNIPWVADFRDPWTQDLAHIPPPTFLHGKLAKIYERKVVEYADRVIGVSPKMTEYMQGKYFKYSRNKFVTITNGFDPDDVPLVRMKTEKQTKFVITYCGSFYTDRSPVPFYNSVSRFLRQYPGARKELEIQLIGKSQNDYEEYPYKIGIGDVINNVGFVPHKDIGKYLANSDIFLLVIFSNPQIYHHIIPGKFFDYLSMKKPMIVLANQGFVADFVLKKKCGKVAGLNNEDEIAYKLAEFYLEWKEKRLEFGLKNDDIEVFNRINLTEQLCQIFNQVTE